MEILLFLSYTVLIMLTLEVTVQAQTNQMGSPCLGGRLDTKMNNTKRRLKPCITKFKTMESRGETVNKSERAIPNTIPSSRSGTKVFLTVSYAIIMAIGVPGNSLMIASLVQLHKNKSARNLFMVNLAIGDLINLLVCIPIAITGLYVSWPYGQFVCKYILPLTDVVIGNSVFTLLAITFERFRAVIYPTSNRVQKKEVMIISTLMWMMAYILIGIPLVVALKVSPGYWVEESCNLHWLHRYHEVGYHLGIFLTLFFIPFILITYCFLRIRIRLQENIEFASNALDSANAVCKSTKINRVIKLLIVIIACFIICFIPINILLIVRCFYREINSWKYAGLLFQISFLLCLCHSIVNPIIMFTLTQDVREAMVNQIKSLFCSCVNGLCIKRSKTEVSTTILPNDEVPLRKETISTMLNDEHDHTIKGTYLRNGLCEHFSLKIDVQIDKNNNIKC